MVVLFKVVFQCILQTSSRHLKEIELASCLSACYWIESSPEEKDQVVLGDEKLNRSWQCEFETQKANWMLVCLKRNVASRTKKVIFPLYSVLCSGTWSTEFRSGAPGQEGHGPIRKVQRRAMRVITCLEHVSCEDRLRELGLFFLEKRRL